MRQKKFDTIAVHGLYDMEAALANQGSIVEPLALCTAQHFENSDHMEAALSYQMPAWIYSRVANPTVHYLEETLALLEAYGCPFVATACATGSGMAATAMATAPFLSVADGPTARMNVVASARCYGGTFMLFSERYAVERGVDVRWVRDPLNLDEWAAAIDENTRFVFGEMPSNPGLAVFDMAAVAGLAHAVQAPLIVDSTVATPALLRPLAHGADIVVQSVSKSMTSSGLAIAGALISRPDIVSRVGPDLLRANFALYVKGLPFRDHGPALSPFNALMTLSDLRTLRLRMDRQSRSALAVAQFLAEHPAVETVFYPGLPTFPGHDIAARDMWLVDGAEDGAEAGVAGQSLRAPAELHRAGRHPGGAGRVRPAAVDLARHGPGADQERGDDPRHLHAPTAGGLGPRSGRRAGPRHSSERGRRASGRHHGGSGSGVGAVRESARTYADSCLTPSWKLAASRKVGQPVAVLMNGEETVCEAGVQYPPHEQACCQQPDEDDYPGRDTAGGLAGCHDLMRPAGGSRP